MKTLYLSLLIVAAGIILYLILTREAPPIIVQPSEEEQRQMEVAHERERDSLATKLTEVMQAWKADSIKRLQENKQSTTVIKSLQRTVNELKISLLIGVPDSTVIEKQDSVIGLQTQIINRQAERIWNDSIYIANIHANFERRLAIQSRETQLLQEEVNMQKQALEGKGEELKQEKRKRVKGDVVQYGVIALLFTIIGISK